MTSKSRAIFILCAWLLAAYSASGEQFVVSGSGGHPGLTDAEATNNIKIVINSRGDNVTVNGSPMTLEQLNNALQQFAKQKGEIWYHKDGPKIDRSYEEPSTTAILYYVDSKLDPASTIALKLAADNHLPVRFSGKRDFSNGIVREVQNLRDVILVSPAPNRPSSEKNGGAGVFRQHINRETGDVTSVTTKQSTGHASLDRCAVDALRQWKYKAPTNFDTLAMPISFVGKGWTIKKE
jgi:TonB family protein